MTPDRKTSIAGAISGVLLAVKPLVPVAFSGVYDSASALVAGVALIFLGYWTNK